MYNHPRNRQQPLRSAWKWFKQMIESPFYSKSATVETQIRLRNCTCIMG